MDKILVIEDDRAMQRALQRLFTTDALDVEIASDGKAGLTAFRSCQPAVVVLDLTLPKINGRELCRQFKSTAPDVPIIIVSANSETDDKVLLLELGADDYVTKPFSPKELLARVRRAMRRASEQTSTGAQAASAGTVYRFADVVVNFDSMQLWRGGRELQATPQEFRLLNFFSKRPHRVVSRNELLHEVWGYQNYPSRTVDNHILHLRQKLEVDPSNPRHFLTVHGAGYKFVPDAGPDASPSVE